MQSLPPRVWGALRVLLRHLRSVLRVQLCKASLALKSSAGSVSPPLYTGLASYESLLTGCLQQHSSVIVLHTFGLQMCYCIILALRTLHTLELLSVVLFIQQSSQKCANLGKLPHLRWSGLQKLCVSRKV